MPAARIARQRSFLTLLRLAAGKKAQLLDGQPLQRPELLAYARAACPPPVLVVRLRGNQWVRKLPEVPIGISGKAEIAFDLLMGEQAPIQLTRLCPGPQKLGEAGACAIKTPSRAIVLGEFTELGRRRGPGRMDGAAGSCGR
jgi:hypothetical protein